jgi:hypothetical protein
MLVLEENQICPHGRTCPHNNNNPLTGPCQGAIPNRGGKFYCEFYVNGTITDGYRNPEDKTGRMKLIID